MKFSIVKNLRSYLPETFAYKKYLELKGHNVEIVNLLNQTDINSEIIIDFMGVRSLFDKKKNYCYIHEYCSSSVPPFADSKNYIKKKINFKPSGRIFLNKNTFNHFNIVDNIPYVFREMGCEESFFSSFQKKDNFKYDLVYAGSIDNRIGLTDCIINLLRLNFKILLIGNISLEIEKKLNIYSEIDITGYLQREYLPDLFLQTRAGLNFMPNKFPYNIQTSTKVLEYCASNLGVLSSKYYWSEKFCKINNGNFFWLENLINKKKFDEYRFNKIDVSHLKWSKILDKIDFNSFLINCRENYL